MRKTEVDLDELVGKSIYIIREIKAQYKNVAVLWSTGKDSTLCLWLIKKAFYGKVPFPVIHIDTGFKFPEIYKFRNKIVKKWNLNLLIAENKEAKKKGTSPKTITHFECCNLLKTEALKQIIAKYKFDAIIVSIRHDEHYIRGVERVVSPRDKDFKWKLVRPKTREEMKKGDAPFVSEQPIELWDLIESDFKDADHVRIHPLIFWTELDCWRLVKKEKLPVNPLYFARKNKKGEWVRFRSLGCMPCTKPIPSKARNIDEIIEELKTTDEEERAGRSQDKEQIMEKLRALGYM